jgi:hypothetical protein
LPSAVVTRPNPLDPSGHVKEQVLNATRAIALRAGTFLIENAGEPDD